MSLRLSAVARPGLTRLVVQGFGIAAAGTFLGEMACYYTFKYLLTAKARK